MSDEAQTKNLEDLMRDTVDAMGGEKPPFYCGDWESKVKCRCTIQCKGCHDREPVAAPSVPVEDAFEEWHSQARMHGWTEAEYRIAQLAWNAALAASANEGKVTWRVELRQPHQFRHYMNAEVGTEEKAQAIAEQFDKAAYDPRIIRISETVVKTRTRKEQ